MHFKEFSTKTEQVRKERIFWVPVLIVLINWALLGGLKMNRKPQQFKRKPSGMFSYALQADATIAGGFRVIGSK